MVSQNSCSESASQPTGQAPLLRRSLDGRSPSRYAQVSMADRDASLQLDALTATGCAVVTDNAYRKIRSMRPCPGTRA